MAEDHYQAVKAHIDIETFIANRRKNEAKPLFDYLLPLIKTIITGRPSVLESHIPQLTALTASVKAAYAARYTKRTPKQVNAWLQKQLLATFNYDHNSHAFTKFRDGAMAYHLADKLGINTCPYCNAKFTFTIKKSDYKTRPHFDHFINKAKHPYFALSFYNLIPSCYVCNSNLKGSKQFSYTTHLHPYLEGINEVLEFKTKVDAVDFLVNKTKFQIIAEHAKAGDASAIIRAEKSILDFRIVDRYNNHKDYAADIITRAYMYNRSAIKGIFDTFEINGHSIFSSPDEIVELILGNYIHEDRIHQRILTIITKDIAAEVWETYN